MAVRVRVPPIVGVSTAIEVYWNYPELGNAQIEELFGRRSPNTVSLLKKAAWELMREEGTFVTNASRVPTATAFRAWGLDINDLTERYTRLQRMKLIPRGERS